MQRARRVTTTLAVAAAVTLVPALLLLFLPREGTERFYLAGATRDNLLMNIGLANALLVEAAIISAAFWAERSTIRTRRWLTRALHLVAVVALLPLAVGCFGTMTIADEDGAYTRFDAPDGTPYLLRTEHQESGMLAVYEKVGLARWRLFPAFGERYGLPGDPPCHPQATTSMIVVRCGDGTSRAPR